MKAPPLMIAAALLFWGWQSGQLILSVLMAVFLEGARLIRPRFGFTASDFNRISNLCVVIFLVVAAYFFATNRSVRALFLTVQWLPLAFILLISSQIYGTTDQINVSGFFLIMRRKYPQGRPSGPFINMSYPYVALCILSASVANISNHTFYIGLIMLSAWALWCVRSARVSTTLWAVLFCMAVILGYVGHVGLHQLQLLLERKGEEWFAGFIMADRDPFRSTTAIGYVGPLKQSDKIVFRVKLEPINKLPFLLREASYNIYRNSVWMAKQAQFRPLKPDQTGNVWLLDDRNGPSSLVTVGTYLKKGRGLLKLPLGTIKLSQLPAATVQVNRMGAVKVEGGPGFITYQGSYRSGKSFDSPPDEDDFIVPEKEKQAIKQFIRAWNLEKKSPQEITESVKDLFAQQFYYSLIFHKGQSHLTPLSDFLLHTRSGHCEYFATATVLLLRELGIPSRYASGYSIQEFDPFENGFVVRDRHAHAWTLAYIDGIWQNVDTTPSSWTEVEAENASLWQSFMDLWFFVRLKFSEWRWREKNDNRHTRYLRWLFVPVIAFMVMMLYTRKKVRPKKGKQTPGKSKAVMSKGSDSPFFKVEKKLIDKGFTRNKSETVVSFIKRIEHSRSFPEELIKSLSDLVKLHYRIRFDPQEITLLEKESFHAKVENWLKLMADSQ